MQRRPFGRDGTVSAVGFGCMSFGGFYGADDRKRHRCAALARALELGVDFWDTANVYGEGVSETLIGKFLAEDRSRRTRVTLATKFAIRREPDGRRVFDNSPGHIRESLEGSLKRLGVDQHRSLLRPPGRPSDADRGHGRRTRPARRGRDDRRDRPQRGRARHAPARPCACTRSRRCSRNIRSGLAIPNSGSFRPARKRGAHGRLLAARTRLFQRPPAGRRDVRARRISGTPTRAFRGSTGGATATACRPFWRSPNHGA